MDENAALRRRIAQLEKDLTDARRGIVNDRLAQLVEDLEERRLFLSDLDPALIDSLRKALGIKGTK